MRRRPSFSRRIILIFGWRRRRRFASARIREARLRAGLSQGELGTRVGKDRAQIARWERGAVEPSFETLRELASRHHARAAAAKITGQSAYGEFQLADAFIAAVDELAHDDVDEDGNLMPLEEKLEDVPPARPIVPRTKPNDGIRS